MRMRPTLFQAITSLIMLFGITGCTGTPVEAILSPQPAQLHPNVANAPLPPAPAGLDATADQTSNPEALPERSTRALSRAATADLTAIFSVDPTIEPDTATLAGVSDKPQDDIVYRVKSGDTLGSIALAFGVSLKALVQANGIRNPDIIWAGQELVIPTSASQIGSTLATTEQPAGRRSTSHATQQRPSFAEAPGISIPELQPLPRQTLLEGMLHDWQKMNNCGPTTVAMALSYYGHLVTQLDTAPVLKGSPYDKNVSPPEIVDYLHSQNFGGKVLVNGNIELLQRLVSNGIPVIVEQWLDRPGDELTGHYRLVRGYDQATQEIIVNDSYAGPRLHFSYAEFDRLWRPFNRLYIPVYEPDQEALVQDIVGRDWVDANMYQRALETAQSEIKTRRDAYAWFNAGNSFLGLGDDVQAAQAFDRAIDLGLPPRMFWYQFGPFEAYNNAGQYQRVLELSAPLTELALEELHYQRGVAHEAMGHQAAAFAEYQRAVTLNPRFTRAAEALSRLQREGNRRLATNSQG